jgi:parallel beta-helix repeat protein
MNSVVKSVLSLTLLVGVLGFVAHPASAAMEVAWDAEDQNGGSSWRNSGWAERSFRILIDGNYITRAGGTVYLTLRGRSGSDSYRVERVSLVKRDGSTLNGVDSTWRTVTFGGTWDSGATVPAGGTAHSDPIAFELNPGEDVFVTYWVPANQDTVYLGGGSQTSAWVILNTDYTSTVDWQGLSISDTRDYIYVASMLEVATSTTNQAPEVDAGPDAVVGLAETAQLNGTVTDDGLPVPPGTVTTEWMKVSGPGNVLFGDSGSVDTTAEFSEVGEYLLRLTAFDGELSGSDEVGITVAATPQTLEDLEPRIPIHAADLPLIIAEPGSYYLTEDIVYTGGDDGITIDADNVTIDLMGFSLTGGSGDGIVALSGADHIEIKNGTVTDWSEDGVDLSESWYVKVSNLRIVSNEGDGISAGHHGIVEDCIVTGSGFFSWDGAGIRVTDGIHVRGNMCQGNLWGILLEGTGNRIEENHLRQNDEGIVTHSSVGGNIIVKNSAGQSYVAPYSIHPANDIGPIGTAATSTSPWANIVY